MNIMVMIYKHDEMTQMVNVCKGIAVLVKGLTK